MESVYTRRSLVLIDSAKENLLNVSDRLLFIAAKGRGKGLGLLCNKLVNVDCRDHRGLTPLMHAARSGSKSAVSTLLQHRACVEVQDRNGHDALWHAVHEGSLKVVELLLTQVLSVDSKTIALLEALRLEDVAMIELLLAAGASVVKVVQGRKYSALNYAKQMGNSWYDFIWSKAVQLAIQKDDAGAIEALHNNKVQLNVAGPNGVTLLMEVIRLGKIAVAMKLMQLGCDVNCKSSKDCTALVLAVSLGYYTLVEELVLLGADYTIRYNGQTLMRIAANLNRRDIVDLLLDSGARDKDVEAELDLDVRGDDTDYSGYDSSDYDDEYDF